MSSPGETAPPDAEWLEADARGGFASGTVGGDRRRRYHALLLTATAPPGGRVLLVNGCDAWVETPSGRFPLSTQWYAPGVRHPEGCGRRCRFVADPWPTWTHALPDGTRLRHELFVHHASGTAVVTWTVEAAPAPVSLEVRPFLSGRDPHALQRENAAFAMMPHVRDGQLIWQPYSGVPALAVSSNGDYAHEPRWYRNFLYEEERARGLDDTEDLAAPGAFRWTLAVGDEAVLAFGVERIPAGSAGAAAGVAALRATERARRAAFATRLDRSADAYVVQRGHGDDRTIVAGYPWFTDWGRDTFIALRGLCLATGRLDDARRILLAWAPLVSDGMLPNRFPEDGAAPDYNSVDAALWYVVAVHEWLGRARVATAERRVVDAAVDAILDGYARGTRYGIRLDADGLIAAGVPGLQLTWMDAKVGDWVVTPRIGKPVEIQALWLNALRLVVARAPRWRDALESGSRAFGARFVRPDDEGLYDVVDVDHRPGTSDPAVRPNQIFAVGGLPFPLLDGDAARAVVAVVERRLWTPAGLRSLAAGEVGYAARYQGGVRARDGAYHQGTVWPWLLGPFVEAWVRVHGGTPAAKQTARARFLAPLLARLDDAGIGHVPEIADAEPPHAARGCPFQAWSLGELLRLDRVVLR